MVGVIPFQQWIRFLSMGISFVFMFTNQTPGNKIKCNSLHAEIALLYFNNVIEQYDPPIIRSLTWQNTICQWYAATLQIPINL